MSGFQNKLKQITRHNLLDPVLADVLLFETIDLSLIDVRRTHHRRQQLRKK